MFKQRSFSNKQRGFTLVELLVTISIFVLLTGIVLFSQSRFNSTIFLTNLAYDTALTLRQAQTFGINIKNFVTQSGNQFINNFTPYGVHFDLASPQSFILFSDLDFSTVDNKIISDGLFDGNNSDNSPNLALCETDFGCVNRYAINRGNYIKDLCVANSLNNWICGVEKLDIVFVRPNPDAQITINNETDNTYQFARIDLTDLNNENVRKVIVQGNGLIYVKIND